MKLYVAIACGGALGAVSRFVLAAWVQRLSTSSFPWGTLAVNALGSFLMGFLFVYLIERSSLSEVWRFLLTVGFLGSLTTFSTFSLETVRLLQSGAFLWALGNIMLQVFVCLTLTWLGVLIARI